MLEETMEKNKYEKALELGWGVAGPFISGMRMAAKQHGCSLDVERKVGFGPTTMYIINANGGNIEEFAKYVEQQLSS